MPAKKSFLLAALPLIALALFWIGRAETVPVSRVDRGNLNQSVVASGRVRTPQRIEVAAQITARIEQVAVREGDSVTPGQTLITLDAQEWQAAAAQARASLTQAEQRLTQIRDLGRPLAEQTLRQAEAQAQQAERTQARVNELVAKGFYSPAQRDDAQRNRDVAESQRRAAQLQLASQHDNGSEHRLAQSTLAQAQAALAVAQTRLNYATLRAPVAGKILTRSVEPGDMVQPGKVLLTLAPANAMEITAQIDEKNLAFLALGQSAQISADAYPDQRFAATLNYIAPAVDALRGSVEIRLSLPQPPAYLKHEMTVSLDIQTAQRDDTLHIPCDTLRGSPQESWVMVVREGLTARQPVRVGLRGSGRCEILEGLAPDSAILPASSTLPENRRVRTVDR